MTCVRKRQIHRDGKQISGCQEPGREEESLLMGTGCLFGGDEIVLELDNGDCCTTLSIY